jgi:hypothetical protein
MDSANVYKASGINGVTLMRVLAIHIGEGYNHIILAASTIEEAFIQRKKKTPILQGDSIQQSVENFDITRDKKFDELFVLHDQIIPNGADLSLLHKGHFISDLLHASFKLALEALNQFRDLEAETHISISSSLLKFPAEPERDPLVREFMEVSENYLVVLNPDDEALWMLRGTRGVHPSGALACLDIGFWRTSLAIEVPGRAPLFYDWPLGSIRAPNINNLEMDSLFPKLAVDLLNKGRLFIACDNGWNMAAYHLGITFFNTDFFDKCVLKDSDLIEMHKALADLSEEERNMIPMLSHSGDRIVPAINLLLSFMKEAGKTEVSVCSRGIVHGLATHIFYEGSNNS